MPKNETLETKSRYDSVAQFYNHRPGYNPKFFNAILHKAVPEKKIHELTIADIGSGNGVSRKALVEAGCNPKKIYEIEPNGAMRELSKKTGGLNIIPGTASNTKLPGHQSDVIIFCNSIHQATTDKNIIFEIQVELNRIATRHGKIIFVAQRFNPQDKIIQDLHDACEKWKEAGLYPAYGDNGIKFILNNSSDVENTKSILNGYPELFMQEGYQEATSIHHIQYNEEEFMGLMRSYLSFPATPTDELLSNIRNFFNKHSDKETNLITVSCAQVAIIGKPQALKIQCRL